MTSFTACREVRKKKRANVVDSLVLVCLVGPKPKCCFVFVFGVIFVILGLTQRPSCFFVCFILGFGFLNKSKTHWECSCYFHRFEQKRC